VRLVLRCLWVAGILGNAEQPQAMQGSVGSCVQAASCRRLKHGLRCMPSPLAHAHAQYPSLLAGVQ
jgi:hypothetical protein